MEKLVQIADENKVDFVFAISPGNTIDLESESDFEALVSKCETMYKLGVRHFAIFFDDISVSRRHAAFLRTPEGTLVRDSGSLNGTYVNRELVDEMVLQHGDEVQIGKYRLVYFASPQGVE